MAFIFYKKSTDKERIRSLSYPYSPLLQDYFSPKYVQTDFATYLNCYKWYSRSRKRFEWRRALDYKSEEYYHKVLFNDANLNYTANTFIDLLCQFDCSNTNMIVALIGVSLASKTGGMSSRRNRLIYRALAGSGSSFSEANLANVGNVKDYGFIVPLAIQDADVKCLRALLRYGFGSFPYSLEYSHVQDTVRKLG